MLIFTFPHTSRRFYSPSECHKEQRVRGAKGQKKSQRMKICINLMRFQEASRIFINSSAKDTRKKKSSFLSIFAFYFIYFFTLFSSFDLFSGEAKSIKQKEQDSTRIDGIKERCGRRMREGELADEREGEGAAKKRQPFNCPHWIVRSFSDGQQIVCKLTIVVDPQPFSSSMVNTK